MENEEIIEKEELNGDTQAELSSVTEAGVSNEAIDAQEYYRKDY